MQQLNSKLDSVQWLLRSWVTSTRTSTVTIVKMVNVDLEDINISIYDFINPIDLYRLGIVIGSGKGRFW